VILLRKGTSVRERGFPAGLITQTRGVFELEYLRRTLQGDKEDRSVGQEADRIPSSLIQCTKILT
jgi:hypothetical protein